MKEFEFTLKFILSDSSVDPDVFIENLAAAGCDDAIIGIGRHGRIAFNFCREGESAKETMLSAIMDVKSVILDAKLIEASPDMVGVSEAAELLGCSRQNLRNLMLSHHETFPAPSHESKQLTVYRLSDVLHWFQYTQIGYNINPRTLEIAEASKEVNIYNSAGVFDVCDDSGVSLYSQLQRHSPLDFFSRPVFA